MTDAAASQGNAKTETDVMGVVLAGGLSRRMGGGDKSLLPLSGRPMLAHAIDRLRPQVSQLALNANGDPARFAEFGLPVVPDILEGHAGPLAGVLTGMDWAKRSAQSPAWIATVAADTPFFPTDLVPALLQAATRAGAPLAVASSNGRRHPVFGLWHTDLFDDLHNHVFAEGVRKVDRWTARHQIVEVAFEAPGIDPFFNVNIPEDLTHAETVLRRNL